MSKDVTTRIKLCSCESKSRLRRLVSRCEEERQCPRIADRAVVSKLRFYFGCFLFAASSSQRFGKRPLIVRKWIQLRRVLQGFHSFGKPVLTNEHFPFQQQRWRIIALESKSECAALFCFVKSAVLKQVRGQPRVYPRGGFGIVLAAGTNSQVHRLDRSRQIAFEPAHMRRASVCAKVRLQTHHSLIGCDSIRQFSLFHQRI